MPEQKPSKSERLLNALQRIARFEGRILRDTDDLQALVDDLMARGVIVYEGNRFRICWNALLKHE